MSQQSDLRRLGSLSWWRKLTAFLLFTMLTSGSVSEVFATDAEPEAPQLSLRDRTIKIGDIWCTLPMSVPTQAEIVGALPDPQLARKNLRTRVELIQRKLDEPRAYPLVGTRRMLRIHFKCSLKWDGGSDVLYIDHDHLLPTVDWPTATEIVRALPETNGVRKNVTCRCELLVFKQEEEREYPLVGKARLCKSHYRCTVNSDHGKEVVFIDRNRLESIRPDELHQNGTN